VSIAAPSLHLFNKIEELIPILESFKIPFEVSIVAAHRAPNKALYYIHALEKKG
jgi:phosphoribosylcarboxyaminoimidazole (NCAIR) mutase